MANDMIKVQLSLKKKIVEEIDELAKENYLSRAAVVSLAVQNQYKKTKFENSLSDTLQQILSAPNKTLEMLSENTNQMHVILQILHELQTLSEQLEG